MGLRIENEHLTANFLQKGAELCSLKSKKTGIEHLWQADPGIWGGHAPVLFPIVGRLQDDRYRFKGKTYGMSQHGFARKRDFEVTHQSESRITFLLEADEESLKSYPFYFELHLDFELFGNKLLTTYKVANTDKQTIYFSIGAHPGFNCALHDGEKRSDYTFRFSEAETLDRHLIEAGLYTGKTEKVLDNATDIPITDGLFKKDALVFKNQRSAALHLLNGKNEPEITVAFEGFPYLGLWSQAAVPEVPPYVCIEPWFGLADNVGGQADFSEKEGIQPLKAGGGFTCQFATIVHNS